MENPAHLNKVGFEVGFQLKVRFEVGFKVGSRSEDLDRGGESESYDSKSGCLEQ
jgi:hypothetical protein